MTRTEQTILKNLIYNEEFSRKVLPFIQTDYFSDRTEKLVHQEVTSFILKYNALPTFESLYLSVKVTDGFCLVGVTVAWGGLCERSFGIGVSDLKVPGK
jgi:hypothetical protein